jgi:hypothetical protein
LAAEPRVTRAQIAHLNAMLASSHRLAHAMMALEAALPRTREQPPRPEFRNFAEAVDKTLELLSARVRGGPVAERAFPDLRDAYLRLSESGDPETERYALVNVESDRMTNSLNTLREQVFAWRRLSR